MTVNDERWIIYLAEPNSDSYKGYRLDGSIRTKPNMAKLSLTNGEDTFESVAESLEDAFIKAFDLIDAKPTQPNISFVQF